MKIKKLLDDHSTHSQTITSLVRALKESDSDTEAHVKRTQAMGRELGRRIGLTDLDMSRLTLLCLLHDIGKVGIPLEILNKPGKLTREEWEVLKSHSEKGYQIAISSWELRDIADMILYHHERWDGRGYPVGLAGEAIPVLSRIISIVDSYDAMVNDRSYRKAMTPEEAKAEIKRCSGGQFDPYLAAEFLSMLEEMPEIAKGIEDEGPSYRSGIVIPTMGLAPDYYENEPQSSSRDHNEEPEGDGPARVTFSRYIMDLEDRILSVDSDFEKITGYSQADINDHWLTQADLIPSSQRQEYFNAVAKQLSEGDVVYMEHELVRSDGRHVYVLCYAKRHYDSASKTIRTEVIIVDSSTIKAFNKEKKDHEPDTYSQS
jgi:PAS domain S-box-containing protein